MRLFCEALMKKFLKRFRKNIFAYNFIFIFVFLFICFILSLFNIRFMSWFIILMIIIFVIIFILGMIQIIRRESKIVKIVSIVLTSSFIMLCLIFHDVIVLLFAFTYTPEHITNLDGKTYVASVRMGLLDTDVFYYDYYFPFFMGTKERVIGDFGDGSFDPFVSHDSISNIRYTFYDDNGKIIYEKTENYSKDKNGNIKLDSESNSDRTLIKEPTIDDNVLYEVKFGKNVLRVRKTDSVLAGNMVIGVYLSTDSGKKFKLVTTDDVIVSLEAKFKFLDKDKGFIISTGNIWFNEDSKDLLVTSDGGKTFQNAKFNYKCDDAEYMSITDYPYFENEIYNLYCEVYTLNDKRNGYENKKLHFVSNDGVVWSLEK